VPHIVKQLLHAARSCCGTRSCTFCFGNEA